MAQNLARRRGTQRMARRSTESGQLAEYLAFALAGETYAVPIGHVAEILKLLPITYVPRAPKTVLGVASVRGRLVTVIDLRRKFRVVEAPADRKTRILLADVGTDEPVGFVVDEVLQVFRLAPNEIEPAQVLGGEQPPHIIGIGRPPGALLILLDLKPILES